MSNWNKTTRIVLRWTHLLMAWPLGTFIYTPARENEAFVFFMQFVFVPVLVITGLWMWQQARILRLYRRLRQSPKPDTTKDGPEPPEEASGRTTAL